MHAARYSGGLTKRQLEQVLTSLTLILGGEQPPIDANPDMPQAASSDDLDRRDVAPRFLTGSRRASRRRFSEPVPERRLYSVKETCQILNMSSATFWRRVKEFELRKIGRRTFVTSDSVDRFLHSLPKIG
jgi:hypothetical protein